MRASQRRHRTKSSYLRFCKRFPRSIMNSNVGVDLLSMKMRPIATTATDSGCRCISKTQSSTTAQRHHTTERNNAAKGERAYPSTTGRLQGQLTLASSTRGAMPPSCSLSNRKSVSMPRRLHILDASWSFSLSLL